MIPVARYLNEDWDEEYGAGAGAGAGEGEGGRQGE
jgi:hypothetical protein